MAKRKKKTKKKPEKKKTDTKSAVLDTARKKRELALLEKLRNKSLTKAEISELEGLWKKKDDAAGPPASRLLIQKDLCAFLNVTPATVNKWVTKGMPRHKKEGSKVWYYDVAEAFDWRVKHERELAEDEIADLELQLQELREQGTSSRDAFWEDKARKMKVDADNAELERQITLGQVVHLSDVLKDWVDVGNIINSVAMEKIKKNPEHQDVISDLTDMMCEEIQDRIKRIRDANPDVEQTLFENRENPNAFEHREDPGICGFTKADGKPCENPAKKNGLCLVHWNKVKGK